MILDLIIHRGIVVVVEKNKIQQMEIERLEALYKAWERKIDTVLNSGKYIVNFETSGVDFYLKEALFNKIKTEYERAGWAVKRWRGDQRDPCDDIHFS
jgi:hypothetical protein